MFPYGAEYGKGYPASVVTTRDVLDMLSELARLTTLEEGSPQAFKVRAYENARAASEASGLDVTKMP